MTQKRKFPPTPERCYEDPEDTRRVWALIATTVRDDSCPGHGGGYRHLKFHLVSVVDTYDPDRRKIRNTLEDETNDLVIHSQGDKLAPDELYAYGIRYERPYAVDLHRLTRMQQFLATVEKKLEREARELGRAQDYASYVTRLCRILDVRYLIEKREPGDIESSYDDGRYRYTSLRTDGGRFNGWGCMDKMQDLVRKLWTDADRSAAKVYATQKDAERREREEREAREAEEQQA